VIVHAIWLGAITIATQIGTDHMKVFSKFGGNEVPHHMRLGVTVNQQKRRAPTTVHIVYASAAALELSLLEQRPK
jgi:hypothetical protein